MKIIRFAKFQGNGVNLQSLPPGGRSRQTNLHHPIQGKAFLFWDLCAQQESNIPMQRQFCQIQLSQNLTKTTKENKGSFLVGGLATLQRTKEPVQERDPWSPENTDLGKHKCFSMSWKWGNSHNQGLHLSRQFPSCTCVQEGESSSLVPQHQMPTLVAFPHFTE